MFKKLFSLTLLVCLASVPTWVCAQNVLHRGVVITSFTEPITQSIVASPENGVISRALVREGDRVAAGDPLAELNHDVLTQTKRQAVTRAGSTAAHDAARSKYQMVLGQKQALETLIAEGHVNKFELQQKSTEYENAVAQYKESKDELLLNQIEVDRIEAQIQQRIIKSPIDGVVVKIHKELGEHVSTTEPQYATVVRIDQLKARFYLQASRLNKIKVGTKVPVEIGDDRTRVRATVIYVSPIIDSDSGTGRIEVMIDNKSRTFQSGIVCHWIWEQDSSQTRQTSVPENRKRR